METRGNHFVLPREFSDSGSEKNLSEIYRLDWNNGKFNDFMMEEKPKYKQQSNQASFYENDYTKMLFEINQERVGKDKMDEQLKELLQLSEFADEGFSGIDSEFMTPQYTLWNKQLPSMVSTDSLLQWKRDQDEQHNFFMESVRLLEQEDFERSKWSQRHRINKKDDVDTRIFKSTGNRPDVEMERINKKKVVDVNGGEKLLCRHFIEGYCKLGDMCKFKHSEQCSYPDSQKVFLGGLPKFITPEILVQELMKNGFNVINKPKIFRRFSPQVCLGSIEQAQNMLRFGTVSIAGCDVDVRPYKAHTQKELNRQQNINNRSVFLGGVPSTMTVRILKSEIEKMGMKVTNHPQLKAGFIPKVTLASADQAKRLIAKCVIDVNGAKLSVRPYMLNKNRPCKI